MKRLMTLMLGLSLVLGSVAVVFGQDTTKTTEKTKRRRRKRPPRRRPRRQRPPKRQAALSPLPVMSRWEAA